MFKEYPQPASLSLPSLGKGQPPSLAPSPLCEGMGMGAQWGANRPGLPALPCQAQPWGPERAA